MSSDLTFYVDQILDSATLTLSNENALFPAENVQDDRRTRVARTTTNSDNLVIDLGSAKNMDSFFIVAHPFYDLGINALTLQMNATNSWGAPSFSQVITLDTTFNLGYAEFATQSFRYVRLVFTSTSSYCELSRFFIGMKLDIGRCHNIGWSYKQNENSKFQENRYGQKFVDVLNVQKELNLSFSLLDKDQLDKFFELYDNASTTTPFFMRTSNATISNNPLRYAGMFYLENSPQVTNSSFARYTASIKLSEAS